MLCLCFILCEKTEVTVQMPGNRRDGLDIRIRIVTQRHLFCLPLKSYYFQRLIFGFFRCGLFLLDEPGKGLSWWPKKQCLQPTGSCLAEAMVWVGRNVPVQFRDQGISGLVLELLMGRTEWLRAHFQLPRDNLIKCKSRLHPDRAFHPAKGFNWFLATCYFCSISG